MGERTHIAASKGSKAGAKVNDEERQIWSIGNLECVMISCCAGAELQLRRARHNNEPGDREIILREMYPTKSDLYDRARDLKQEHERAEPR